MTTRIYYSDSHARAFDATVEACASVGNHFEVRLDRTAFYPTSGGQPFDTGRIGDATVIDVVDRDDEGIVHVVTTRLEPGARVRGEIDWDRRRDHMEQHTGQHVLSAAFDAVCHASTVGFHMGSDFSTIDLAREVSASEIAAAEAAANAVVRENRAVDVRIVAADDAANLQLRRQSTRSGPLRVVEISGFDRSACGGTHVAQTGEVGMIAAVAWERMRAGTRLTFVCGGRALTALQRMRDTTADAARQLGVAPADLAAHVTRIQEASRESERHVRRLQDELVAFRTLAWRQGAETIGEYRVVLGEDPEQDATVLKSIAQALVTETGLVVVLVGGGSPVPIVAARSSGIGFDAGAFVKAATASLGGRGGGRPELAQGGIAAPASAVIAFARSFLTS